MHIETISNGMGSQSVYMLVLAAEGKLESKLSISADTGSELDRVWSTGDRTTVKEYFDRIIEPYAHESGIEAVFIRSLDKDGQPLLPIIELLEQGNTAGVPLYGSDGGQLSQGCTGKYKIRAVRQELRRRGAKTARVALGLTMSEIHRMKPSDVKWCENWWPLIDPFHMYRSMVQDELTKRNIPFLISTECDNCPHKNAPRWNRTSPEMIDRLAEAEGRLDGLFLTPYRIPLKEAIEKMSDSEQMELFGCDNGGYCWT